jgi:hypothetical protein
MYLQPRGGTFTSMAGVGRNISLAALMLLVVALAAVALPSALWVCLVATLLGLAGVVAFRGNGWRSAALLAAALALSLALLDAFAGLLTPSAHGTGLVRKVEPRWWPQPHPVLGFRPSPNSTATATATYNGEPVYRQTYHIDADGARATPPAPPGADLYLFLGDSFMFGQGLADDETLPSQFAKLNDFKVRTVNLGVPGNSPNILVRAFEAGLMDRYIGQPVKAVVAWIIPAQLARVTGDGTWLGDTPRYVLEDGKLLHTGTFNDYRWRNPLAGLKYLLGQEFAFVDAIGREQRQAEQIELFVAMMARLQAFAREKFGVPLVVIYSWPDEQTRSGHGGITGFALPMLVDVIERLRKLGIATISVDQAVKGVPTSTLLIPHDGHPTALTNELVAKALKETGSSP